MVQLLKQESLRLRGFPLALQLLAYQAIPKLQSTIPIPFDSRTIMDLNGPNLPSYPAPSASDIISVEADPDLQVTPLIPIHSQPQSGWGVWPDVSNDDRVSYMEQLIADHRPFTKDLWHGVDTSAPLITTATNDEDQPKSKKIKPEAPPKNAKPVTKKVLKPRKTAKKKDKVRKQRRISSYFHAASSSSISNDKILELLTAISDQVSKLQKESKLLRKLLKRKKTTTLFKRSAFITLLGEGLVKKGKTAFAHKGCQTEPTNDNVPVSSHDVCQTEPQADISHHTPQAPMEEDHIQSPVVSQYAAQRYGSISHSNLPGFVGHASTINAFSATATSKPSSAAKTKHSSAQQVPYNSLQTRLLQQLPTPTSTTYEMDNNLPHGNPHAHASCKFRGLAPFTCHRINDLYINERGVDCGPVSVKFLEMHAQGDPDHMSSITDRDVDDFRKQYVLDIYKTIVMPAYYG
ncbi:hypothetical protein F2Q69_00004980 [Brassica cretica]|uniref:Ubiquitin-like protease family profile domain-containing protein n=1 Tax=Brassica cretica TaxID=69181 RepID=A0A8S9PEZ9_BRACR|nr:hypothetical protein F2Q69_00004980 [Brassica cretica]